MEQTSLTCAQSARMNLWARRIAACKQSNLTVAQWCAENDVREKSYWRWHKILKDQYAELAANQNEPEFYEVENAATFCAVNTATIATITVGC